MSFLDTLRRQSPGVRRRAAFFAALSVTLLLVLLWVPFGLFGRSGAAKEGDTDDGPISALGASLETAYESLSDRLLAMGHELGLFKDELVNLASSTVGDLQATTSGEIGAGEKEESVGEEIRLSESFVAPNRKTNVTDEEVVE